MIPIPKFSSCSDKGYDFSVGRFNRFIFVGRPMIAFVNGGVPPYTWSITGSAFDLANVSTNSQFNQVVTNSNTVIGESAEEITVSDSCGREASFTVSCCAKYLCCDQQTIVFSVDRVDYLPTGNIPLSVYGGCPPFQWKVTDGDAIFATPWTELRQNLLVFGNLDNADLVKYQVTDICGSVAKGFVYEEFFLYDYYAWANNEEGQLLLPALWIGRAGFGKYYWVTEISGGPYIQVIGGNSLVWVQKSDKSWWFKGWDERWRVGYDYMEGADMPPSGKTFTELMPAVWPYEGFEVKKLKHNAYATFILGANNDLWQSGTSYYGSFGQGGTLWELYKEWIQLPGSWKDMFLATGSLGIRTAYINMQNDLYMTGRSSIGELPFGSGTKTFGTLQLVEQDIGNVHDVVLSNSNTMILCGTDVWATGRRCGFGDSDIYAFQKLETPAPAGGWKKVGGGYDLSWLLAHSGEIYDCSGLNRVDKPRNYFYVFETDTDWNDLYVDNYSRYAFKEDGTFWRWGGNNPYGHLAIGTLDYQENLSPILMNEADQHATMFDGFHCGHSSYYVRIKR